MWICIMRMVVGHTGNVHRQDWRLNILSPKGEEIEILFIGIPRQGHFLSTPSSYRGPHGRWVQHWTTRGLTKPDISSRWPVYCQGPRIHRHVHRPLGNDHMWRLLALKKGKERYFCCGPVVPSFVLFVWPMTGMTESVPWGGVWPSVTCLIL